MLFTTFSSFECLHLIFDRSFGSPGTLPYPKVQCPIPGGDDFSPLYVHPNQPPTLRSPSTAVRQSLFRDANWTRRTYDNLTTQLVNFSLPN
ncbi:hypothetical protein COLO4_37760 [Corchorus olitorius]|uniref:Uncharacterized protein n=1 Tax=Corchorus olitorius TaxID=93759 RepID=A0A1R3FZI0_9ROSI|nr:hypothetical protein COLO4_37760 [Corchorus olitorius]